MEVIWKCRNYTFKPLEGPIVMGVLNLTPDSFSDGGEYSQLGKAVDRVDQMIKEGAQIIDIGGESTRPGALKVPQDQELNRVLPVIEALKGRFDVALSIDTSKSVVAQRALELGASIVNDVTGLEGDPNMASVCQRFECGVVVMHMQGCPETMQVAPCYDNVLDEVIDYFTHRYDSLVKGVGIAKECLCFDPGIGFGKSDAHNLKLLRHLDCLQIKDRPLLLGVSRKSLLGRLLGESAPKGRDWATIALSAYAYGKGVQIHRVHEVLGNVQALEMTRAIEQVHA